MIQCYCRYKKRKRIAVFSAILFFEKVKKGLDTVKYIEAINYINSFSGFSHPASLERIEKIMKQLKNPEKSLRFIHVAGTNGKGSVAAYISSALSFAGEKCGIYSSPFIYEFTERIKIDGKNISKRKLAAAVSKIARLGITPNDCTQFEIITAAAFLCFKKERCDVVVLETGLGGRFDATNVIKSPLCSVITSISYDHTNILGNTLADIAFEKAGIIKPHGITVVSGKNRPEVIRVVKEAADKAKNDFIIADIGGASNVKTEPDGVSFYYRGLDFKTGMTGSFQLENAIAAIEAVYAVYPDINEKALLNGIFNAKIHSRFEILSKNPLIISDGAHNEDGMRALVENLKTLFPDKKIHAVTAICGDKDYEAVVSQIAAASEAVYITTTDNPRALRTEVLAKKASEYCNDVTEYEKARRAYLAALRRVKKDKSGSLLVICGSLFLPKSVFGRLGKIKY